LTSSDIKHGWFKSKQQAFGELTGEAGVFSIKQRIGRLRKAESAQ
jgi:hypothetical protein